jgi:hypothetical protein
LAKEPELAVSWIDGSARDFLEQLSAARYFVAPLGLSAYEAVYLGARPLLLPRDAADAEDVRRFLQFAVNSALVAQLGNGAQRIAQIVKSMLS